MELYSLIEHHCLDFDGALLVWKRALQIDKEEVTEVDPGMDHLIPLAEFAKQLVFSHHFSVTFIVPNFGFPIKSQKSFLDSLPEPITAVYLPPPVISNDLSGSLNPATLVTTGMTRCVAGLRDSLKALIESTRLVALVVDAVGTDAFDLTEELGILRGTISQEQLTELALGLEMSEQKFIWVVRSPAKNAANGVYYNAQSKKEEDPFMERTRTRGLGLLMKS